MATPNPRKRPAGPSEALAGPDKKRSRIYDARTIAVQSSSAEARSGALDIPAFIKSREFEISALTKAMSESKAIGSKRAFQSVPRDMRRRTASHNPQRVPKRLRRRAQKEMADDNTPVHTFRMRKKRTKDWIRADTAKKLATMAKKKDITEGLIDDAARKRMRLGHLAKPPRGKSKWRKRQKERVWLPTHIWHAKRAHMDAKWGFKVAESPNEKCYRPTDRAVRVRGAVAWEQSYYSTILVRGPEEGILEVLKSIAVKTDEKKYLNGNRFASTWAYVDYPTQPIAPVTVLWSPGSEYGKRQVVLRIHPSAFLRLWNLILASSKLQKDVKVQDLRYEIGSFEITGPSATNALVSLLRPVDPTSPATKILGDLSNLTNPGALPPNVMLPLEVVDPRLSSPRNSGRLNEERLFKVSSTWPYTPQPHTLFDHVARARAVKLQSSLKRVHKRRAAAGPGNEIPPLENDPKIPILLLASRPYAPSLPGTAKTPGTWTVLVPWKWMEVFWHHLMGAPHNVRFGGIQEHRQIAFEHGVPWFPADFPGTQAGIGFEDKQAEIRKCHWDRRPKGKKIAWESVDIGGKKGELGDGFRCDWSLLLKQHGTEKLQTPINAEEIDLNTVDPWQIPASAVLSYLLSSPTKLPPSLSAVSKEALKAAVFAVKIILVDRGSPSDRARIYRLPVFDKDLAKKWAPLVPTKNGKKRSKGIQPGSEDYPAVPGVGDLIGFMTTGNFNLREGKNTGIANLGWERVFGENCGEGWKDRWCIVRDAGEGLGRLARWEVV